MWFYLLHLYNVGLRHHPNNNHVERLHGSIRQREKVMRGLKVDVRVIDHGTQDGKKSKLFSFSSSGLVVKYFVPVSLRILACT